MFAVRLFVLSSCLIAGLRPCRSAVDAAAAAACGESNPPSAAGRCHTAVVHGCCVIGRGDREPPRPGRSAARRPPRRKRTRGRPQTRVRRETTTETRRRLLQPRTVKMKTVQKMLMYAMFMFVEHMELAVHLAMYKMQLLYTSLIAPMLPK